MLDFMLRNVLAGKAEDDVYESVYNIYTMLAKALAIDPAPREQHSVYGPAVPDEEMPEPRLLHAVAVHSTD